MRAMRGEFSPSSGDTERADGQILEAMVDFPADIDLKVVSQSLPAAEREEIDEAVAMLREAGAQGHSIAAVNIGVVLVEVGVMLLTE